MKNLYIWTIITISFVVSPYVAHKIHATCNNPHHKHVNRQAINCTYSQKDLKRIMTENKERYCKNCENQTCFYCGCPVDDHSAQ